MRHCYALALMLITSSVSAQTVQKCCGTSNSTFLLGNMSNAVHSQCLYTPGDLSNETDGEITRIYYRYGSTGQGAGNTLTDFRVRMTQTSASAFAGGNLFFTGLDTVLTAASFTIAPGTTGDWFVIELDSTFTYDASLTLVVDISFTGSATLNFGTYSTNLAGRKLYWSDLTSPTGESVVTTWQDIGFDLEGSTAIAESDVAQALLVYPNPTEDHLWLPMADAQALYRVIAADGRVLLSGNWPSEGLDVGSLAGGSYVLSIMHQGQWRQFRFVKE